MTHPNLGQDGAGRRESPSARGPCDLDHDVRAMSISSVRSTASSRSEHRSPLISHVRNPSNGSSSHSSHTYPGSWKEAFVLLREEFGPSPNPDDMAAALRKFLDNLPPFYASAAIDFVKDRSTKKQAVNLDRIAEYFTKLDHSSAEARQLPISNRSPVRASSYSHSPVSKSPTARRDVSPLLGRSPSSSRPTAPDGDHFADFAPSRPHVSNLVLSDTERSPTLHTIRCPPP